MGLGSVGQSTTGMLIPLIVHAVVTIVVRHVNPSQHGVRSRNDSAYEVHDRV